MRPYAALLLPLGLACAGADVPRSPEPEGAPRVPVDSAPPVPLAPLPDSAPAADTVARADPVCAGSDPGADVVAWPEAGEARARFVVPHRERWTWSADGTSGAESMWEVEVDNAARRYTFGYYRWSNPGVRAGGGTLAELLAHGQHAVFEQVRVYADTLDAPEGSRDIRRGMLAPELLARASAHGDTVRVTVSDAPTFARLFSARPDSVTQRYSYPGMEEPREKKVAVTYAPSVPCPPPADSLPG